MLRYLIGKLSRAAIAFVLVTVIIFVVCESMPGNLAERTTDWRRWEAEDDYRQYREVFGMDLPAPVRYFHFFRQMVQLEYGWSDIRLLPTTYLLELSVPWSAAFAGLAILVSVPAALLLGVLVGARPNSMGGRIFRAIGSAGGRLPEFIPAVVLVLLFAALLEQLPDTSDDLSWYLSTPLTNPEVLVIPVLALAAGLFVTVLRVAMNNTTEVMKQAYIRTAILKGLSWRRVMWGHVAPNALLPTIRDIAYGFGWLLGGLVVLECFFAYRGVGTLLMNSIIFTDEPLIYPLMMLFATACIVAKLLADLLYGFMDPRVRVPGSPWAPGSG